MSQHRYRLGTRDVIERYDALLCELRLLVLRDSTQRGAKTCPVAVLFLVSFGRGGAWLELELHLLRVAKLVQVRSHGFVHGGRPASQHLNVGSRCWAMSLDHFLRHEPNTAIPVIRRLIQDIVDLETIRIVFGHTVQFFLKKNIIICDICID